MRKELLKDIYQQEKEISFSFRVNENLKILAMEKAQKDGITLKALLVNCLQDYVSGRLEFGITYGIDPRN